MQIIHILAILSYSCYRKIPRGTGVETRLYESDADKCHDRAVERGDSILQIAIDKPDGIREYAILSHDGHVWVSSKSLAD